MRNRWQLTKREYEVFYLLAAGYKHGEIAGQLLIGQGTVEGHVSRILLKLDAVNARHAIAIALHRGILTKEQIPEMCVLG